MKISRALISVSDKTGLIELALQLQSLNIEILSTGGTAKALHDAGISVTEVAQYTGFPEMLDGRVKTLHPLIHGGILAKRDNAEHMHALEKHHIHSIDLVIVNLYPFEATIAKPDCPLDVAIENIDIGGPSMLRAAAKNHGNEQGGVTVLTDPMDYDGVIDDIKKTGQICATKRFKFAVKAFTHTARYDGAIANYLSSILLDGDQTQQQYPEHLQLAFDKVQDLRYGENPHQSAAFYREPHPPISSIANYHQIQGKMLSYNNIADADAAWECVKSFNTDHQAVCVIVKHANPCGIAVANTVCNAYQKAFSCDPTSAFGGIIAVNQQIDVAMVEALDQQFLEVLIAPSYTEKALALLSKKQNLRILCCQLPKTHFAQDYKRVSGGLLVQDQDIHELSPDEIKVVTKRQPSEQEMCDLLFAWKAVRFIKSNAIIFCHNQMTIGIGAGQMSRVDAARIAEIKAQNAHLDLRPSVAASDAFFPFRDGLDVLAQSGATAVIQPGGSIRDEEVIRAADEQNIAMILTGYRHFRH